jgi:hypothetical protein
MAKRTSVTTITIVGGNEINAIDGLALLFADSEEGAPRAPSGTRLAATRRRTRVARPNRCKSSRTPIDLDWLVRPDQHAPAMTYPDRVGSILERVPGRRRTIAKIAQAEHAPPRRMVNT